MNKMSQNEVFKRYNNEAKRRKERMNEKKSKVRKNLQQFRGTIYSIVALNKLISRSDERNIDCAIEKASVQLEQILAGKKLVLSDRSTPFKSNLHSEKLKSMAKRMNDGPLTFTPVEIEIMLDTLDQH